MKIHYLSCHSILEYDELKLFTELGYEVFSNGAYLDPKGHITLPRPGVENARYFEDLVQHAVNNPKTDLPKELIEPFDVIMVMHTPEVILNNWQKIKHKNVIWRTIGQSTSSLEMSLKMPRGEGMKIVRYSPKEERIPGYIGKDAMIRFYKDENEFCDWNGEQKKAVNFSQALKGRRGFCHYDEIMCAIEGFDAKVYGSGNDDLAGYNGGEVSYARMKQIMRDSRAFVYGGTWPASYTLSFIEALMTGIPVVAISKAKAHIPQYERIDFYEVDEIIQSGVNGYVCDDVNSMRYAINRLMDDYEHAKQISQAGRETAIKYFGKETIKKQWRDYLESI